MNNSAPVYCLSDYLPLGENITQGTAYRTLAGVYDNNGKSLIAGFYDMPDIPEEELYLDIAQDDWQLKPTYKIAVVNSSGKVRIYDTGVNIIKFADTISGTVISMDNYHTVRIKSDFSHANNRIYFEGTLDLNTGVYIPEISFSLQ